MKNITEKRKVLTASESHIQLNLERRKCS